MMYEILVEPSTNETYFNIYDTTLTPNICKVYLEM